MSRSKARLTLPDNPNLEQLREQAKERLVIIRTHAPDARLSDAQFALARDYGFPGWRALKAHVERRSADLLAYTGLYRHDPGRIANSYFRVTQRNGRLLVTHNGSGRKFELAPQDDGRFMSSPGSPGVHGFEKDAAGLVTVMTFDAADRHARMARIDDETARQIDAASAQALKDQKRPRIAVQLTPDLLERYVGHYSGALGFAVEIMRQDTALSLQASGQPAVPLWAEAEDVFFVPVLPVLVHFRVTDGTVAALVLHQHGMEVTMPRVSAEKAAEAAALANARLKEQEQPRHLVSVSPDVLKRYAGRYQIVGDQVFAVTVDDGKLFAELTGKPKREIFPESETKFFWTHTAAQIEFFSDHSRRVTNAVLHQHGQLIVLLRLDDAEAAA
jgi:hypothetical protein